MESGPAGPLRAIDGGDGASSVSFLSNVPGVTVIAGQSVGAGGVATLAALGSGQVPVPQPLHPGVELPSLIHQLLRPVLVTFRVRHPDLQEQLSRIDL